MFGGSPRHHHFETPYAYRALYRERLLHRPHSVGPSCKLIKNYRLRLVKKYFKEIENLFIDLFSPS
jgi:hypothetical protein